MAMGIARDVVTWRGTAPGLNSMEYGSHFIGANSFSEKTSLYCESNLPLMREMSASVGLEGISPSQDKSKADSCLVFVTFLTCETLSTGRGKHFGRMRRSMQVFLEISNGEFSLTMNTSVKAE